jgi:hypothetical protein
MSLQNFGRHIVFAFAVCLSIHLSHLACPSKLPYFEFRTVHLKLKGFQYQKQDFIKVCDGLVVKMCVSQPRDCEFWCHNHWLPVTCLSLPWVQFQQGTLVSVTWRNYPTSLQKRQWFNSTACSNAWNIEGHLRYSSFSKAGTSPYYILCVGVT